MTGEIHRFVSYRSETLTPFFWNRGCDSTRFESAVTKDPPGG